MFSTPDEEISRTRNYNRRRTFNIPEEENKVGLGYSKLYNKFLQISPERSISVVDYVSILMEETRKVLTHTCDESTSPIKRLKLNARNKYHTRNSHFHRADKKPRNVTSVTNINGNKSKNDHSDAKNQEPSTISEPIQPKENSQKTNFKGLPRINNIRKTTVSENTKPQHLERNKDPQLNKNIEINSKLEPRHFYVNGTGEKSSNEFARSKPKRSLSNGCYLIGKRQKSNLDKQSNEMKKCSKTSHSGVSKYSLGPNQQNRTPSVKLMKTSDRLQKSVELKPKPEIKEVSSVKLKSDSSIMSLKETQVRRTSASVESQTVKTLTLYWNNVLRNKETVSKGNPNMDDIYGIEKFSEEEFHKSGCSYTSKNMPSPRLPEYSTKTDLEGKHCVHEKNENRRTYEINPEDYKSEKVLSDDLPILKQSSGAVSTNKVIEILEKLLLELKNSPRYENLKEASFLDPNIRLMLSILTTMLCSDDENMDDSVKEISLPVESVGYEKYQAVIKHFDEMDDSVKEISLPIESDGYEKYQAVIKHVDETDRSVKEISLPVESDGYEKYQAVINNFDETNEKSINPVSQPSTAVNLDYYENTNYMIPTKDLRTEKGIAVNNKDCNNSSPSPINYLQNGISFAVELQATNPVETVSKLQNLMQHILNSNESGDVPFVGGSCDEPFQSYYFYYEEEIINDTQDSETDEIEIITASRIWVLIVNNAKKLMKKLSKCITSATSPDIKHLILTIYRLVIDVYTLRMIYKEVF